MSDINAEFGRMTAEAGLQLAADGIDIDQRIFMPFLDLCYWGQNHELAISVDLPITEPSLTEISQRFHQEHRRNFGFDHLDRPIKCVNLRLSALGKLPALRLKQYKPRGKEKLHAAGQRSVILADGRESLVPIYAFEALRPGDVINEPAIVEYSGSTLFIHPGWTVTFDNYMTAHARRVACSA